MVKNSDVISGEFFKNFLNQYKEYDKRQKQIIYDLSNDVYDLKLKVKELEEELTMNPQDPLMQAFLEIIEKHCDTDLFNKVRKWLRLAEKSMTYRDNLIKCEKRICELHKKLEANGLQ